MIRRKVVAASGSLMLLGLMGHVPGAFGQTTASGSAISKADPDCTTDAKLVSVRALTPSGAAVAATDHDRLARVKFFSLRGGVFSQVTPPEGWRPESASAEELRTYGFPPRPTDRATLPTWQHMAQSWKRSVALGMCETNRYNYSYSHTATSSNWAGGMNVNGSATTNTFTQSSGQWREPSFVLPTSECALNASAYSIWSGLGGWNSEKLAQAGISNAGAGTNTVYPWWEVLDHAHPNPEVKWKTGLDAPEVNDDIYTYTQYTGSRFNFFVEDLRKGTSWSMPVASYNGDPASAYYDGTTSDFITEAPGGGPMPGNLYALRKPTAPTYYYYASTNGHSLSYYPSWRINEVSPYSGHTMQTSSFNGGSAWYDTWYHCA